jgi:hypothetical protein
MEMQDKTLGLIHQQSLIQEEVVTLINLQEAVT